MKVRAKGRGQLTNRSWKQKGEVFECDASEYREWMEPLDNEARACALALVKRRKGQELDTIQAQIDELTLRLEHMKQRQSPEERKLRRDLEDVEL